MSAVQKITIFHVLKDCMLDPVQWLIYEDWSTPIELVTAQEYKAFPLDSRLVS